LDKYRPGIYAVKVVGTLPDEVVQSLEVHGVRYIPRDGSQQEEEV
jgi:transcription elongation factor SPT4